LAPRLAHRTTTRSSSTTPAIESKISGIDAKTSEIGVRTGGTDDTTAERVITSKTGSTDAKTISIGVRNVAIDAKTFATGGRIGAIGAHDHSS
jgi:hypothetical protein